MTEVELLYAKIDRLFSYPRHLIEFFEELMTANPAIPLEKLINITLAEYDTDAEFREACGFRRYYEEYPERDKIIRVKEQEITAKLQKKDSPLTEKELLIIKEAAEKAPEKSEKQANFLVGALLKHPDISRRPKEIKQVILNIFNGQ